MVKQILLRLDEKMFFKLKEGKMEVEKKIGKVTWEDYVRYLFKKSFDFW